MFTFSFWAWVMPTVLFLSDSNLNPPYCAVVKFDLKYGIAEQFVAIRLKTSAVIISNVFIIQLFLCVCFSRYRKYLRKV